MSDGTSIIKQAAKRLEELRRGGVDVPWAASGLSEARFDALLANGGTVQSAPQEDTSLPARRQQVMPLPAAAVHRREAQFVESAEAQLPLSEPTSEQSDAQESIEVAIDLDRLARAGYLVPSMVRSDLALEFRNIKRTILRNADQASEKPNRNVLIMVTSALPAEGKTFCAINLAMSMAMEVDTSVLLVDADVVRPSVMDRLGLPPAPGFMDVLKDDTLKLGDVVLRTNVPKLSILPAGTQDVLATELLASGAMDRLLVDLATRYSDRVVILDGPPLLITSESRVLASRVGQVIVVVDSSSTTAAEVTQAFATVESCPLVMSVLNKCATPSLKQRYNYGYDY